MALGGHKTKEILHHHAYKIDKEMFQNIWRNLCSDCAMFEMHRSAVNYI